MDPYLEKPPLWKQVHTTLIVDIRRYLAPLLRPRYRVAIEECNFRTLRMLDSLDNESSGFVFTAISHQSADGSYTVTLPEPIKVIERYLEVRHIESGEVITVIEILSPSNKLEDRQRYERKRRRVLNSMTNLVEIDLLRSGKPMSMVGEFPQTAYRILVSRALQRPDAQVFPCGLRQPIPAIPIPLRPGEDEPYLPLNQLLHTLYDSAGYDLFIDYRKPPVPPLSEDDLLWAQQRLVAAGLYLHPSTRLDAAG
jgi:hypothetical protein